MLYRRSAVAVKVRLMAPNAELDGWEVAVDEEGFAGAHLAEDVDGEEGDAGCWVAVPGVLAHASEVAGDVFLAGERAYVVEAALVAHAGEEQLAQVVGEDRIRLAAVHGFDLGL